MHKPKFRFRPRVKNQGFRVSLKKIIDIKYSSFMFDTLLIFLLNKILGLKESCKMLIRIILQFEKVSTKNQLNSNLTRN